jgi:hypothetical protein
MVHLHKIRMMKTSEEAPEALILTSHRANVKGDENTVTAMHKTTRICRASEGL